VLEDLDAMIDDGNRAFFLNELDGFGSNAGVAVIATTNHPDKLDPAILDRPSRFDRKYHFELPQSVQREAYVAAWNRKLQPEMKLTDSVTGDLVVATEGFSFAYLKELLLSATVQWMSNDRKASMDEVVRQQVDLLRAQIKTTEPPATEERRLLKFFKRSA
jgi:ATP-dependent 26S proteasome regulatory subunit